MQATDLPFVIKICGITSEEDARIAVDAGANALGFNLYDKSPRFITVRRARQIIDAVPGDYLRVGIFVNTTADEASSACEHALLDVAQLHGDRRPELPQIRVWQAVAPEEVELRYAADAYLYDTPWAGFGGSGRVFDWNLAARRPFRVLIAGGLDGSNVARAIETALPWGVDACSRLEARPGKKDARKILEFVQAARESFRLHMQQEISL